MVFNFFKVVLLIVFSIDHSFCCIETPPFDPYGNPIQPIVVCFNVTSLKEIDYFNGGYGYNSRELSIQQSNISEIGPSDFSGLTMISKLYLGGLGISKILPGGFSGLVNLRELYLNDNSLTIITHGVYNSLHQLQVLDLSNNKIFQIEKYSFMGTAISKLHLNYNNLSTVENDTFEQLTTLVYLDMSENPLELFPFSHLPTEIRTVNVSGTFLKEINANLSHLDMELFDLSYSDFFEVDFTNFPKVAKIDLSNNKIVSLKNCQKLVAENVSLGNNELQSLDNNNCHFIHVSKSLNLDNNKIETLDNFEINTGILILDFSHNQISTIENSFFDKLEFLQKLFLQHNHIRDVNPNLFLNLANLHILNLSENEILKFQFGTFDSLENLKILDVSYNKLTSLSLNTLYSLYNLNYLYFENNQISSFSVLNIRNYLPGLLYISLDNNSWNCEDLIHIKQYLKPLGITISEGFSYDTENVQGIACSSSKEFRISSNSTPIFPNEFSENFGKALSDNLKNSKMEQFLNENFDKSNFARFFDTGYTQSNFFKYLSNYKFAMVKQEESSNDSKVEKLTALELKPNETSSSIAVFSVVLQVIVVMILVFIGYLLLMLLKRRNSNYNLSSDVASRIELL